MPDVPAGLHREGPARIGAGSVGPREGCAATRLGAAERGGSSRVGVARMHPGQRGGVGVIPRGVGNQSGGGRRRGCEHVGFHEQPCFAASKDGGLRVGPASVPRSARYAAKTDGEGCAGCVADHEQPCDAPLAHGRVRRSVAPGD